MFRHLESLVCAALHVEKAVSMACAPRLVSPFVLILCDVDDGNADV